MSEVLEGIIMKLKAWMVKGLENWPSKGLLLKSITAGAESQSLATARELQPDKRRDNSSCQSGTSTSELPLSPEGWGAFWQHPPTVLTQKMVFPRIQINSSTFWKGTQITANLWTCSLFTLLLGSSGSLLHQECQFAEQCLICSSLRKKIFLKLYLDSYRISYERYISPAKRFLQFSSSTSKLVELDWHCIFCW